MMQKNESAMRDMEIDVALRSLGEVPVPAAMASRIQRSLDEAAAAEGSVRFRWPVWVPAACAAVGVVLVAGLFQAHVRRGTQRSTGETARTMVAAAAPPQKRMDASAQLPAESFHKRAASVQMVHATVHAQRIPRYRHAANLFNYPLTGQEKLLVQFARTATPAELQDLNPEYQAKMEAQQEAAFAAYVSSGNSSDTQESETPATTSSNTSQE